MKIYDLDCTTAHLSGRFIGGLVGCNVVGWTDRWCCRSRTGHRRLSRLQGHGCRWLHVQKGFLAVSLAFLSVIVSDSCLVVLAVVVSVVVLGAWLAVSSAGWRLQSWISGVVDFETWYQIAGWHVHTLDRLQGWRLCCRVHCLYASCANTGANKPSTNSTNKSNETDGMDALVSRSSSSDVERNANSTSIPPEAQMGRGSP
jgi:hypothetical protein